MKLSDLQIHHDRLQDVRSEIVGQGDSPPAELENRLRDVRALIAEVRRRRLLHASPEPVRRAEPLELDLEDLRA